MEEQFDCILPARFGLILPAEKSCKVISALVWACSCRSLAMVVALSLVMRPVALRTYEKN